MGDAVVGGCGDHILVVEQNLRGVAVSGDEDQCVDVPECRPKCRPVAVLRDGDADTRRLRFLLDHLAPYQGHHVVLLLVCQQPYDLTPKLSVGAGHCDPHCDLSSSTCSVAGQPHRWASREQPPKTERDRSGSPRMSTASSATVQGTPRSR